ncbi:E3 ubiquitin-protein ligase TRIM7-like isoform X2 [Nyctibius grandis]|uniref:E3 ubiquitin-protein ligase TRIM7-like isoform X2 n=1 Tax=Nyctibius grandis TaxID=48427 RepID=UPI0035BC5817
MASASSGAREGGEEVTHHTVLQHHPDPGHLGCDPTSCGGGTARSWPERGRLGDAEAVGHQSRLRKGNFQPKQHLEHLAEKLKLLDLEGGREEKELLCSWSKRTVTFKGDAQASGSSRDGPRARGGPTASYVEESTQEDKEQTHHDLEKLKRKREEILELKMSGERRCHDYLTQTEVERQKIVSEFRQLRRFLKDQELVLLARLGELDREMMRRQEEEETKMAGEISLLDVLICEMEKKLEQPAGRFLQVGCSTEQGRRGSGATLAGAFTQFWGGRLRLFLLSCYSRMPEEPWTDILPSELEKEQGPSLEGHGKAFVTLDPDTANAQLILSRDRRGVRWSDVGQDLPTTTPQRFDASCCVLGCRGFTTGRHWWEVEVVGGRTWALGVARCSVPRKGWLEFQPEKGIWAMGRCGNRYRAFTSPITTFPATGQTGRVRVALDYGGGQVAFYLAERQPPIFTFQEASFGGESIFPFFWVGRGCHLRLCP